MSESPPYKPETLEQYRQVSTATVTTVLLKKGLRNVWLRGSSPAVAGQERIAGPAFTMRFIPAREDLATPASWASPKSSRAAIEAMPEGYIAVVDSSGCKDAGIFGDILCQRMVNRGALGLVTDGVLRDIEGVSETGLKIWSDGVAAPPSVAGMTFVDWQEPIGCGGVAVFPNDLIVADQDGAVVVPAALVEEVLSLALEQEELEAWILEEVKNGAPLSGMYPISEENRARYEASRSKAG